jgi:hypothetical protein
MRLPRSTTRRLMVLVPLVALSLCVARLYQLRIAYQGLAASHAAEERRYRDRETWAIRMSRKGYVPETQVATSRMSADSHAALRRKYERAALSPWLPIPPDSAPPR